jgi:Phosphotransferase enzyme family
LQQGDIPPTGLQQCHPAAVPERAFRAAHEARARVTAQRVADEVWLPLVGRRLGSPVRVVERAALTGGYVAASVERVELDVDGRSVTVVVKAAGPVEVAAMRAIAVVGDIEPRPLAVGPGWLVLPFVNGAALGPDDPVPAAVWRTLATVHAHWRGRRPRGVPVVDAAWWAALCDRTLVAVRGGLARTGEREFSDAERALVAWRAEPAITAALARMPRTLVHGDAHRGNVLGDVLIDWGNARVAPASLDLATLRAQGATLPDDYPQPPQAESDWADVQVHVQYLGFAADHLGAARVGEMIATAAEALARLRAA